MPALPYYRNCTASQYLVVTGAGIRDVKLCKKSWIMPGQRSEVFDIAPANYEFEIQAMSAEKLPFILPAVFTIGPKDSYADLVCYAELLASARGKASDHVSDTIQGISCSSKSTLAALLPGGCSWIFRYVGFQNKTQSN